MSSNYTEDGTVITGRLNDAEFMARGTPVTDTKGGTRYYDLVGNVRATVTSTSTAATALPTLYDGREIMVHASTRCFIRFGTSGLNAASVGAGQLIAEAGVPFHFRVNPSFTHFRVIRETADGSLTLTAVIE